MTDLEDKNQSRAELKSRILAYPRWYHSFHLDEKIKITGWAEAEKAYPPSAFAENSFLYYHLPERWAGKSVLDIGGWDGALAFEMERRGSTNIVLVNPKNLDDLDLPLLGPGSREEIEKKYLANGYPLDDIHSGGARLLIRWFDSRVRILDSSVYNLPEKLQNPFDLTLFLGLLYHLRDPLRGLEAASRLTREMLILETMCFPEDHPLAGVANSYCEFLGGRAGHNWWTFNHHALEQMLRACGFRRVEQKQIWNSRCVYHAFK
jgi:tRNA (mo5U34)-methyltransferase